MEIKTEKDLSSPLLGPEGRIRPCHTCGHFDRCVGHFGYIQLYQHLVHPGYLDVIRRILQSVCFNCKRIKVKWDDWIEKEDFSESNSNEGQSKRNARWIADDKKNKIKVPVAIRSISPKLNKTTDEGKTLTALAKYLRTLETCAHCGSECEKTKKVGNTFVLKNSGQVMNGEAIFNVFKDITHEDCMFMRIGNDVRPEWFLFYRIMVVPPMVRPEKFTNGRMTHDDLTIALRWILRKNLELQLNPNNKDVEEALQFSVTLYYDPKNIKPSFYRNSKLNVSMAGLLTRQKAKEGRLRGNLMGKRVDQCARNVITGDSHLKVFQVGIPTNLAHELTVPVMVNWLNMKEMTEIVARGYYDVLGAKNIIRYSENEGEKKIINLKYANGNRRQLIEGDIVERYLRDKDCVMMNRQPTLHRNSALAHEVVVMRGTTFRLNVMICPGYNADFDGD